jgi:hypothetical protein
VNFHVDLNDTDETRKVLVLAADAGKYEYHHCYYVFYESYERIE